MGLKVKISIGYILLIFLLTTVILLFRGKEERKRRRTLEKEESELAGVRRLTAKVYMSLLDLSSHAEVVSIWTDDDFHNYCTRQDTVRKNLKALRHYVHTPEQQAGDPDQTYAYELSGRLVQASRGKARWSSHTTPWDFRSGKRPAATPYSAPTTIPAGYSRSTVRQGPRCATPATATGSLRGSRSPTAATPTVRARGNRHTATTRWVSRWSASFREASSARSPTTT